jgi:hypothetical protein
VYTARMGSALHNEANYEMSIYTARMVRLLGVPCQ